MKKVEKTITLREVGTSTVITIPALFIENLGWETGDEVTITYNDEELTIRK